MDDFEEAVEMGYLEKFLRQDHDMAETSQTIGEDELDKLMREMTDADLDSLVDHLSVDDINQAELANLGASTPPSRSAKLPPASGSGSGSTGGLVSGAAAGVGAAGAAATAAALSATPAKAESSAKSVDAKTTPTKSTEKAPTEKKEEGGLLASVGAAVSELSQKASEALHGVEQKIEGLTAEPASVAAAREELEEGTSPIKETRAEPPVESSSRTAGTLVADNKREVASPGPLPNEPTLDELIDTTLAKESIEAEKKAESHEKADSAEGEKERSRLLAETKQSEANIHAADKNHPVGDSATATEPGTAETLVEKAKAAVTDATKKVESSIQSADAKSSAAPTNEPTLDSLIDKTMQKEHEQYEAKKTEDAKKDTIASTQKGEQTVHASDAAHAAAQSVKKTE